MKILIDSDVISALSSPEREEYQQIRRFISSMDEAPYIYLSMLTVFEIEFNIASFKNESDRDSMRKSFNAMVEHFNVLNIDLNSARIYGEMKQCLRERTGINKNALKRHNIDIALASVAIANDCTVISRDKIYAEHLQKIDVRLQYQQW